MKNENFEVLFKLPKDEEKAFGDFIREKRELHISSPKDCAKKATENNQDLLQRLLKKNDLSNVIVHLRSVAYEQYLKEESQLNSIVLSELSSKFRTPKKIIEKISSNLFNLQLNDKKIFEQNLIEHFGNYAGAISPYIYQLCLSNTQSRRSRAGKTFEGIIYFLYELYGYSFDSQAQVGRSSFANLGLGKIVDSILPSIDAFNERRDKTIIGSMKTTLRERWQEVVEEVSRSNVPNIYLLTVDDDISESKAIQMGKHNIVLVVLKEVKNQEHLINKRSIIDFETYFLDEIPNILNYWKK
ncbi:type II restriction endonuclease [Pasteurella sp. PK-2025]|uniref:type II restriction endonuclease n=1 Tax=unclassified Pasteurella TaxID=2621516 RepID=UPI003C7523FE